MNTLVDTKEVYEKLKTDGYFIFKNLSTINLAESARTEYLNSFGSFELTNTGFSYSKLLAFPIRKKNISSANGLGESYAQVMQTVYYPKENNYSAISEMFKLVIELRNEITGMRPDYGDAPQRDKFWNARRIHHYPRGGGFMVMHKDTYFPKFVGGDRNFVQILFLLSKKGTDFLEGGGRINDLNGNLIDIEDSAGGFGSIVFFDGRILHGVADVDPSESFSLENKSGRLAAVSNLYEYREG
jgi:hypothetical protein